MVRVLKGNKREIPEGMPVDLWFEKVFELREHPLVMQMPFYHDIMEYLPPDDLRDLKAKAFIWWDVTGDYPRDISTWWEVRLARKRGDLPNVWGLTWAEIDDTTGVLTCGKCAARWAPHHDGTPHDAHCGLCGARFIYR